MWRAQAEAEGLTLLKADNKTGYFGVYLSHPGRPKPYQARVWRGGKWVHLGCFVTAEERGRGPGRRPGHAVPRSAQAGGRRPAHASRRLR